MAAQSRRQGRQAAPQHHLIVAAPAGMGHLPTVQQQAQILARHAQAVKPGKNPAVGQDPAVIKAKAPTVGRHHRVLQRMARAGHGRQPLMGQQLGKADQAMAGATVQIQPPQRVVLWRQRVVRRQAGIGIAWSGLGQVAPVQGHRLPSRRRNRGHAARQQPPLAACQIQQHRHHLALAQVVENHPTMKIRSQPLQHRALLPVEGPAAIQLMIGFRFDIEITNRRLIAGLRLRPFQITAQREQPATGLVERRLVVVTEKMTRRSLA